MVQPWKWVLATVVVVAAVVALVFSFPPAAPPVVTAAPLATATFADGGQIEIVGVSVGERTVEISKPAHGWNRIFKQTGSSGGTWGGMNMATEEENGQVLRCRVSTDAPRAMLVEIRTEGPGGRMMPLPMHLLRRGLVFDDARLPGGKQGPNWFEPSDDRVESLQAAMQRTGLTLLIQHRDPSGRWIHLKGPAMFHEPWPDRYMVALDAWQRDAAPLDFRAIRDDGAVATFSLPNPDRRATPTAGTTTTLPTGNTATDYLLELRKVERLEFPGHHPFAWVDLELTAAGKKISGTSLEPVRMLGLNAEDEWGNVIPFEQTTIAKKARHGAYFPAGSRRMTVRIRIARTQNSPRHSRTGYRLLEGVVSADGTRVDFKPGPDAATFGIAAMPAASIAANDPDWGDAPTADWRVLTFQLKGASDTGRRAIESRIGPWGEWQPLVFPDGSAESAGLYPRPMGCSGGTSGDGFRFEYAVNWLGSPAMLRPGARIAVGIHGPPAANDLRFDLELPPAGPAK